MFEMAGAGLAANPHAVWASSVVVASVLRMMAFSVAAIALTGFLLSIFRFWVWPISPLVMLAGVLYGVSGLLSEQPYGIVVGWAAFSVGLGCLNDDLDMYRWTSPRRRRWGRKRVLDTRF